MQVGDQLLDSAEAGGARKRTRRKRVERDNEEVNTYESCVMELYEVYGKRGRSEAMNLAAPALMRIAYWIAQSVASIKMVSVNHVHSSTARPSTCLTQNEV